MIENTRIHKMLTVFWFILSIIFLTIGIVIFSGIDYEVPTSEEASHNTLWWAYFIAIFTILVVFLIICGILSFLLFYASFKRKKWMYNKGFLFSIIFFVASLILIVLGEYLSIFYFFIVFKWLGVFALCINITILVFLLILKKGVVYDKT